MIAVISVRTEQRRHAAVLVLRELAQNTPTLFNVHVASFLDHIWVALRDPKDNIRTGGIEALRACLVLISKRDARWRTQWYDKIFSELQQGFKLNSPESIHGSLMTIGMSVLLHRVAILSFVELFCLF